MGNDFVYIPKSKRQLEKWFSEKSKEKIGFKNFEEFEDWYSKTDKRCYYCGLTEMESQELVIKGTLKSKRFPQHGKHGRGTSRAMWLEIDRYDPDGKYESGNVVLACYFCNNDKSDIFHGDDYKLVLKDKYEFLKKLIAGNKQ